MVFGAYLVLAGLVWLIVLFARPQVRWRLGAYTALSLVLALLGLALFTLLSSLTGLMRFGVTQQLSIPQDYLARGLVGLVILLVGLVGLLSPAVAGWLVRTRRQELA